MHIADRVVTALGRHLGDRQCGFLSPGVVTSSHACGGTVGAVVDTGLVVVVPASMSAWVIVWLAVHVIDAPGASDEPLAGVQLRSLTFASVTVTAASVVLPLLVAMIV